MNQAKSLKPYEMILASAGSGKTYRLTTRMIALMALGLEPKGFSALTFTKKAAGEFREQWLKKLADGSLDAKDAAQLSSEIGIELSQAQFLEWLEKALAQLPKMFLSTLDAFCFKVLSMMQHELGMVGSLQMADENETQNMAQEVLQQVLADESQVATDFITIITALLQGKEAFNINSQVQFIIKDTLNLWEKSRFEGELFSGVAQLATQYQSYLLSNEDYKNQCEILEEEFPEFLNKTGKVNANAAKFKIKFSENMLNADYKTAFSGTLGAQLLALLNGGSSELTYSQAKATAAPVFTHALQACLSSAAAQELLKQERRLRALNVFLERYYNVYHHWFIEQGKLSFDLVRSLLHEWLYNQQDEILAQKMDWLKFRLDASYQHWFLDEFQDTSGQDLAIIEPFLQEALHAEDHSVLVVGDKKQSIYGFRGGDYTLFNQLQEQYPQFELEKMAESWRSTPPVLELVNRLFGDSTLLKDYWGESVLEQWEWQEHISAKPLQNKAGVAKVLQLNPAEDADKEATKSLLHQSLIELIHEQPNLHWGVLCRNNNQVAEVVAALRSENINVIENGRDTPIIKHPLGVLTIELLYWLEFPKDKRAWSYLLMSPLHAYLKSLLPKDKQDVPLLALGSSSHFIWQNLHQQVKVHGFIEVWQTLMEQLDTYVADTTKIEGMSISATNCRQLIEQQLQSLDQELYQGDYALIAKKLANFSQKVLRGEGLIEVMTVHASKGLTFDASIYAIEDTTKFPNRAKLNYLELGSAGGCWLGNPPAWLESTVPQIGAALQEWQNKEAYAEICTTYVALTRARQSSYLILPAMANTAKIALPYWLAEAFSVEHEPSIAYEDNNGTLLTLWEQAQKESKESRDLNEPERTTEVTETLNLNKEPKPLTNAQPLLRKKTPSQNHTIELESNFIQRQRASRQAMDKGSHVHAAFEHISWLDQMNITDQGIVVSEVELVQQIVTECLENKAIYQIMSHDTGLATGETKQYHQEQAFDVLLNEEGQELWLSGIIDRLHLIKDSYNQVIRAEIIDFKTDKVVDESTLIDRHQAQLKDYAQAVAQIYALPLDQIHCYLVSTDLKELLQVQVS